MLYQHDLKEHKTDPEPAEDEKSNPPTLRFPSQCQKRRYYQEGGSRGYLKEGHTGKHRAELKIRHRPDAVNIRKPPEL